jgi:hypothetical protein
LILSLREVPTLFRDTINWDGEGEGDEATRTDKNEHESEYLTEKKRKRKGRYRPHAYLLKDEAVQIKRQESRRTECPVSQPDLPAGCQQGK